MNNITNVYYFDNKGKAKLFLLFTTKKFEEYEGYDDLFHDRWTLIEDSIIEINGGKYLLLEINDSIMIMDAGYDRDWSRIDTFRAAPRSMIPDEFYHRY